ncbi:hypothetical protein Dsin_012254 [Dipteronia sinensis]|uniref:RNase H type-1 domain-containing protein n=1 Tax=Dipteronia sinensis TaxID=43782 RepID=A0AAE0AJ06_9ROSI|nr:hypothetical protein Dsin_012254 [Dipteronia sinensis]
MNSLSFNIGATIRDDKGKVLVVRSNLAVGYFSAEVGQLIALREGLLLAKFYNFPVSLIEFSSSNVAAALNCHLPLLGDVCCVVNDIKVSFLEVGNCKCQASPKSRNSLAQNLASLAFSSVREYL